MASHGMALNFITTTVNHMNCSVPDLSYLGRRSMKVGDFFHCRVILKWVDLSLMTITVLDAFGYIESRARPWDNIGSYTSSPRCPTTSTPRQSGGGDVGISIGNLEPLRTPFKAEMLSVQGFGLIR